MTRFFQLLVKGLGCHQSHLPVITKSAGLDGRWRSDGHLGLRGSWIRPTKAAAQSLYKRATG
jgi:hypothetical protein